MRFVAALALIAALHHPAHAAEVIRAEPSRVRVGEAAPRLRAEAAPTPPRFASSLGIVRGNLLDLADRRAPGFAIVAAQADVAGRAWRAATVVTVIGHGELPTQTRPGARVFVEIEGVRSGPVRADKRGRAVVPVDVSPAARVARVIAVDARGLETVRELPLPAADFPRALVLAPASLGPGGRGVVSVFAIDARGAWRGQDEPAPEIDLPPGLTMTGRPRPAGAGRWDVEVVADPAPDATTGVTVGARVDGSPAVPAGMELRGEAPPVSARPARVDLSLRAGYADSFDDFASGAAAVEAAVTLRRGPVPLALVLGVGVASGQTGIAEKSGQDRAAASQLLLELGGRAQLDLSRRVAAEAHAGLGWSFASAELGRTGNNPMDKPPRPADADALLFYVGGALAVALGPGAILVDLRWSDVRLEDTVPLGGSAVGLWLSAGYRIGL